MGETCRRPMTTEIRIVYNIFPANVKGSHHFKDLSVDGRIILKCILKKQAVNVWNGFNWLLSGFN